MIYKKRVLEVTPFVILALIISYTWYLILTTDYFATIRHQIALALIVANLILYFFSFRYAIFLTGIILLLATFNKIALFPRIESTSFFVKIGGKEFETPSIQWRMLLLLIGYLIINFSFWLQVFGRRK